MSILLFFSFALYCFVTSITPGPNNIMLISSGFNFGFKRTIPHILGIGIGFFAMFVFIGFFISHLFHFSVLFYECIKIIGIVYLLYLSYQLIKSSHLNISSSTVYSPFTFMQAAVFQWINPKAWIMAIGAISTYTSANSSIMSILFLGFIYCIINIPSTSVWAYIGSHLQKIIHRPKHLKLFNLIMASLLIISIINPMIESWKFLMHYF
ncbi:LysE family translocator [Acinetobacter sp. EC24]|nr:LysE family translocator [Acinetobacter rathckeae]MBF7694806.1 LysE family translocator [Acinetobacter rathckeae]